jgi:A/G-specific adenine glycosylase
MRLSETIQNFRRQVYNYFKQNGRTLPWRTDYNPYHILVSEIMLQQTQVDRVTEKFVQFISAFPTLDSLADAPLERVLSAWQGLGYNRRANSLREAARQIIQLHKGVVPDDPEALKTLPGIGPATAASIAAFAYNKPTLFLETNIRTVYIHHFFPDRESVSDDELLQVANAALDRRNPRKWYSALMDYGTMLKKTEGNLSRKSLNYKKQAPFQGSKRQLRGMILKTLVTGKSYGVVSLARKLDRSAEEVREQLNALAGEGLLVWRGRTCKIAD